MNDVWSRPGGRVLGWGLDKLVSYEQFYVAGCTTVFIRAEAIILLLIRFIKGLPIWEAYKRGCGRM